MCWSKWHLADESEHISNLNQSSCLLCRLFGSVAFEYSDLSSTTCYLFAHPGHKIFNADFRAELKVSLISVVGIKGGNGSPRWHAPNLERLHLKTGFLGLTSPARPGQSIAVHPICSELYDVGFAKRCMTRCRDKHDHVCHSLNMEAIPFFRLIDCQSRKVIAAPPDSEYAALSYVWGAPVSTDIIDDLANQDLSDLHDWPKVVTDSLQVALEIGLKHLWVDKYCINQFDDEDKATQIGQMDLIYANAQVTIIAAAGKGPHYGLAGVAGTLRKVQPALRVGDHHIASTLPHGSNVVLKSKWATRGWTYQEGILSRRRLIFTDQQVFFECNSMHCAEAVQIHTDQEHSIDDLHAGIFDHRTPGTAPWDILKYVREFRKRDLTYQSDSLNALSGIFRAFVRCERPLYQLMGVPIFFPVPFSWNLNENRISKTANQGFLIGLTWMNDRRPQERVPMFPSWSWAGWNGGMIPFLALHRDHHLNSDNSQVWIETDGGKLLAFPTHESLLQGFIAQLPRSLNFIHIEARTFPCSLRDYRLPEESPIAAPALWNLWIRTSQNLLFVVRLFFVQRIPQPSNLTTSQQPWPKSLTGILVGDTSGASLQVAALIVRELDGFYERVGCSGFDKKLYREDGTGLKRITDEDGGMEMFSRWMREDIIWRTIRLG